MKAEIICHQDAYIIRKATGSFLGEGDIPESAQQNEHQKGANVLV